MCVFFLKFILLFLQTAYRQCLRDKGSSPTVYPDVISNATDISNASTGEQNTTISEYHELHGMI